MAGGKLGRAIEKERLGRGAFVDPAIMAAIFGLAADTDEAACARRDCSVEQSYGRADIVELNIPARVWPPTPSQAE